MPDKEQITEVDALPVQIKNGAVYSIRQANPNSYTHGMFKYPCKFIPEIPRWGIRSCLKEQKGMIFDPFAGSGTTLLEANLNGLDACGAEIDDIAKLIIKVKTTPLTAGQLELAEEEYEKLSSVLMQENAESFRPDIDNLEHWFSESAILKLGRMKIFIDSISDADVRDFFKLCMVSIIKKVSMADDTSPKPYVSNKVIKTPPPVESELALTFRRYKQMLTELSDVENLGKTRVIEGDALNFSLPAKADLAITSPPYINAFDYGRTMRLENLWMGVLTEKGLRDKKKDYIGTEKLDMKSEREKLAILQKSSLLKSCYERIWPQDEKRALIVKKFFEDMDNNLAKVYESLNPGGRYMIVIGNSMIRQVNVESWRVLTELAGSQGFCRTQYFSYIIQNPYIRIPRQGMGGKISRDYVLVLEK